MREQDLFLKDETSDAVIAGGGVIGLAIGRALAARGLRRVTLVERGRLGAEASSAAGGMLAVQAEADRADAFLELALKSREMYPAFAASLLEETGIDVELERTGTLYLAFNDGDAAEIDRRFEWQSGAGLSVEKLTREDVLSLEPCVSPRVLGGLKFPLDVQVENRRLVAALAAAAERYGVRLMTGTDVLAVRTERGRVQGVETSSGPISTPFVIIACGAWSSFLKVEDLPQPPVPVEPVRGQMLCFDAQRRLARHVIYSPRGYIVPRLDGRLLAGSTTERAGFDKSVTGAGLHAITEHALEIAPGLGQLALVDAWAGLRPRSPDDLPVIGPSPSVRGLFYATGHYRNGILLAPVTGDLIASAVTGGAPSPLLADFAPDRFHCAAAV